MLMFIIFKTQFTDIYDIETDWVHFSYNTR